MKLQEIFEVLKKQGIEVVKDTKPSTFTRFRLIGPGFDSSKSWVWWSIRDAYDKGRISVKEREDMRKFDKRIRPGTKVLLNGYGRRGWYTVEAVHPSYKLIKIKNFLGYFQSTDIKKFSNYR